MTSSGIPSLPQFKIDQERQRDQANAEKEDQPTRGKINEDFLTFGHACIPSVKNIHENDFRSGSQAAQCRAVPPPQALRRATRQRPAKD